MGDFIYDLILHFDCFQRAIFRMNNKYFLFYHKLIIYFFRMKCAEVTHQRLKIVAVDIAPENYYSISYIRLHPRIFRNNRLNRCSQRQINRIIYDDIVFYFLTPITSLIFFSMSEAQLSPSHMPVKMTVLSFTVEVTPA
jgi:hypothetical protein